MSTTWDQLTESQKIEEVRRDVLRMSAALKDLSDAVDRGRLTTQTQGLRVDQFSTMISELHHRLAQVEAKLS